MNEFGDERKLLLEGLLDAEEAAQLIRIAREVEPIVLGITFWNCFRPWDVPVRRICDNFFFMTVSGEERVTVNGETRVLRRGDAMIVPEFVPHSFGLADGCEASSHYIAHALAENVAEANPFAGFASPFLRPKHPEAVLEHLETIVALRNRCPSTAQEEMKQLFRQLMREEVRCGRFRLVAAELKDERIGVAVDYINRNFRGEIAVSDMAQHVRLGEAQFRKLFRRELGIAPGAYLQRTRLIHAARLLARYNLTLAEVAERSGFSGECYFSSTFRRCFDRTPGQYRRYIRRCESNTDSRS